MNSLEEVLQKYHTKKSEDIFRKENIFRSISILQADPHVIRDEYLTGEKDDDRYGLSLVLRPGNEIKDFIHQVQRMLAGVLKNKAGLWLVPRDNLHFTFLELVSCSKQPEVDECINKLNPHLNEIKRMMSLSPPVESPLLILDQKAIAMTFISKNESFLINRALVFNEIALKGIKPAARYYSPSIHITIARFVEYLNEDDIISLIELITSLNKDICHDHILKDFIPDITQGLNYYGKTKN